MQKILLNCGILSSLLYVAMNIFIPMMDSTYNPVTQTVSELSAIDAPTRPVWFAAGVVYTLLLAAFGVGTWQVSKTNRMLRTTAVLILINSAVSACWPPMHMRGNEATLTDTLHIAWAMMTILLMMLIMGFGAAALGKKFRIYTAVTFIIFAVFGILIGYEAPGIPQNLPTPRIGIWERINIGAFMIWVIVFAGKLLQIRQVNTSVGVGQRAVKTA